MLRISGFAKDPRTKALAKWVTDANVVNHVGEIEMLLHDVTEAAKQQFGMRFEGPALVLIENVTELEAA